MELHQKGWLKEYANYVAENENRFLIFNPEKDKNISNYFFIFFRNLGLFYGVLTYPKIHEELTESVQKHSQRDKLIFLEFYLLWIKNQYPGKKVFSIIEDLGHYLYTIYQLEKPTVMSFSKIEEIFEKQIYFRNTFLEDVKNPFFWLDLYFFGLSYQFSIEKIQELRAETLLNIYQILKHFSTINPSKEKEKMMDIYFQGISNLLNIEDFEGSEHLESLDLHFIHNHWMVKKYILEILTFMACIYPEDNLSEVLELEKLRKILKISVKDRQESVTYIESFLIENPQQIGGKSSGIFKKIYNHLSNAINKEYYTHKKNILSEIRKSAELVELLKKSANTELTEEEKKKVKKQLLEILKTIPAFTIFMIPGGSILLPILIKLLPKELLLPSSYYDEDEEPIES